MRTTHQLAIIGFALLLALHLAHAQQAASGLTVQQAVNIALEKNPLRKAALADIHVAQADRRVSRSFLLPHLGFSETATRGNDPVYVFGSRLRQQRFSSADFALNKLNTPQPLGNFATRFAGTWNLFDGLASWRAVTRSRFMDEAAAHQLTRTEQEIAFRAVSGYYDALLAAKQLDVAEQAVTTAQAIVDRSQARFDSGLVVESDLLTAKVHLATRRQELIRARNSLDLAKAQLNTVMGVPLDSSFELSEALAERDLHMPALAELEAQALTNRPDLKRIAAEEAAQHQNVSIAKASFSPQINAFAGWELDNPTFVSGGGGNNWLGGIEVNFTLFQGGAKRAELSRQRALADKSAAMKQAAADAVRLEVRRAYYDTDASRQQVEVARAAIAQAKESLRVNQDRYDSGLTTIIELLGAEDASRRSQADYWQALYRVHTSYASLQLASGTLNSKTAMGMP